MLLHGLLGVVRRVLHGSTRRRALADAPLGSMNASHGCVLLPTHSAHYGEAHANLLSMLRFATDAQLPPVYVVIDRESERQRLGGSFPAACASSRPPAECSRLATFVHVVSLEGLLDTQGDGIRTQQHVLDAVAAEFAAWSSACRRTRSAAACADPSWQLGAPALESERCSTARKLEPSSTRRARRVHTRPRPCVCHPQISSGLCLEQRGSGMEVIQSGLSQHAQPPTS